MSDEEIVEYNVNPKCKKCGYSEMNYMHIPECIDKFGLTETEEHLRVTCIRCHWWFKMRTCDNE